MDALHLGNWKDQQTLGVQLMSRNYTVTICLLKKNTFRTFNMHFTIIRFCFFWLSHFANHLFSVSFQSPEAAKAPAAAVEGPMTPHPPALQGLGLNPWDLFSSAKPRNCGPRVKNVKIMWEERRFQQLSPGDFKLRDGWGLEQQREGFHPCPIVNPTACVISMTTPSNFGLKNLPWQFDNLVRRTVQASYQGALGTLGDDS